MGFNSGFKGLMYILFSFCRFQWPRGLKRKSVYARLLELCVRALPGAWMPVSFERCVLSGRGLCVGLITRPTDFGASLCVL